MMNSSTRESPQPKRNLNESSNITTILPPQITSTPFISNKTKIPSPLVSPTRKFLGPRRYALSNNGMLNPVKTIKDPPGPLLASTAYDINVSTYIDTKSPGYTGRLMLYNEESSRKKLQTHQLRYGSPGLFPIVHLFKKDVPVISPKLKKGTIRIGTPESRGYYSQEHNRLLLEGIVRNNSILKEQNNSDEVSTRSVLDALKEISRKRIHANEEYDPIDENNKKFRKANGDGDYLKRNRVESPPSDKANSSPTTQAKKRLCTIDAVLASKTSSMYATVEGGTKRKSNEDSNNIILPMNKKKYNNVETQTFGSPVIIKDVKTKTMTEENVDEKSKNPDEVTEVVEELSSSPKQVLKVLDDKPLEVIRKNRLGALLSALSGREIPSIPMEDRRKALDQEWPKQTSEKALVSILSPRKNQTKSTEKHVTFNLPQSTQSSQSSSSGIISQHSSTIDEAKKKENTDSLQNKNSISIPSSGESSVEEEKKSTKVIQTPDKIVSDIFSTNPKLETTQNKIDEKDNNVAGFKFDLSSTVTSINSDAPQVTKMAENNSKPEMSASVKFSPAPVASSIMPMFGAPSPKSEFGPVSSKSMFDTSFTKSPQSTNSLGLPTSLPLTSSTISPVTTKTPVSSTFGLKPTSEGNAATTEIGNKTTPAAFTFGNKETIQSELRSPTIPTSFKSITAPPSEKIEGSGIISSPFGSKNIASVGEASPAFAFNAMNKISTNFVQSSNSPASCSSLTTSTISSAPSFCTATSVSTESSASVLGANAPNSIFTSKTFSAIAASSESPKTGISNSGPGGFKFNSPNPLPAFGSPSMSSISTQASTITPNAFSSPVNILASSTKPQLGNSNITGNPFGGAPPNTASSSMFGNNSVPNTSFPSDRKTFTFGFSGDQNNAVTSSNSTSGFTFKTSQSGVTTTNTTASTASNLPFGSTVPTNASNMFSPGKNITVPSLGAASTASSFGTSNSFTFGKTNTTSLNTSNTTASIFSTTDSAPFGTTNNLSFGNSNTPNFGATNSTNFGTTNKSSLGTTNTSNFGTTNTAFIANNTSFGTTSTSGFGTANTSSFSTANTSNAFGSTNTPTFGTNNTPSFDSTNASNFGSTNTPAFGSNNTNAFGAPNTPAFGNNNITSSNTNNAFGGKSTVATAFGSNNSTFGTPTNTPNFGTPTTTSSFQTTFSSPGTLNAPSFGNASSPFGSAVTNNTNTFNSNNISSPFGTSGTNSFGTFNSNNTQFTPVTTASTFGTNTNNTFGNSSAANAFGGGVNASNNTFGSSNPASPFSVNNNAAPSNAFGSGFVKKPEQSSGIFPASTNNMFSNTTTFGSAPPNNTGNTSGSSTSGVFTFGSANSNASSSAGLFTFGASEPPKSFNFNAPGTVDSTPTPNATFNSVPSFAQPSPAVPNMFSIGSGNTSAPQARGRPLVRARRRT